MESRVIETGVDKLVGIVKSRGRIALSDAAKELGVSTSVIQEWVDFLEEEGIIGVEYNLTKPFLVEKKLTKKEVQVKEKEFASKKDVFVKKAESNLGFLERQAGELENIKEEFDKLRGEMGMELDRVKEDLKELEKYQQIRHELQRDLEGQRNDTKAKIDELSNNVLREQKRYIELVEDMRKESSRISKEKATAKSIEGSEKLLNSRLTEMKGMIALIEKKLSDETMEVKDSELHIDRLNTMMEDVQSRIDEEKRLIEPLVSKSAELEVKINQLQGVILKKLVQKQKDSAGVKNITQKVKAFFDKKLKVMTLMEKVNQDRDDLEKSMLELIKKAKSVEIAKNKNVTKEMKELEEKFNEVDKKKAAFESELKNLVSYSK